MALVNPNIAMSYRGVELPQQNALADYAAVQQIQSGQRQAEVSQMQIDAMRRDEATLKQIQDTSIKHGGPTDLDSIADAYLKSGNAKFVEFGIGLRQKLDEKKQFASIMGNAPRAAAPASEPYPGYNESIGMAVPAAVAAPASEPYPGYNQAIGMTPSVNAMAPVAAPVTNALADVAMLRQRRDALLSMGTPQAIAAARALDSDIALASKPPTMQTVSPGGSLVGPSGNVIFTAPATATAPPNMVAEYNFAKTTDGGSFKGSFRDYVKFRGEAGRPPPQPRAESPLVAIIGPDGSPILVSRENAVGKTPANTAEKPMTQAQRVKYTKDKVSDKDVVTGAFAVTGELEKLTDELVGNPDKKIAPAPGLSSITGFSALTNPLALPSGDARKALQKLETFKGKIMALGRQLASQEGKLGNMAVQEWKFVSDAVQKIDPAAGNLDVQMRDVVRQAREYSQRQQAKYDDTYADDLATQGGGTAPAAVGANVVVTPDGRSHTFPTPAAAAAFKKAAGL